MEKFLNKLGNILYYTFNFLTLPILMIVLGSVYYDSIPNWIKITNDVGQPCSVPIITLLLIAIIWRYQYLISEAYSHEKKFGLDFYKHKNKLEKFKNAVPNYNKPTISNHLEKLFKRYCNDETICIRHIRKDICEFRGGELSKFTEIDKNIIPGYNNTGISDRWGYKIDLGEEPALFLVELSSRFYYEKASLGANRKYIKEISKTIKNHALEYGENSIKIYKYDNEICIFEYAIIMGSIIDLLTESEYNELRKLHRQAEFNYDKYMLNKRHKS